MWLVATLAAACFQISRTAMQQRLRGAMGPNAAGFVRYAFGAPIAVGAVAALFLAGTPLPALTLRFLVVIALGGLAQIVGTNLLIRSFELRDFAVGTAYSKTEAAQVALLSAVLLGEAVSAITWAGILTCLVGVVVLAAKGDASTLRSVLRARGDRAMSAGIAAGGAFGLAAICIRSASMSLGTERPIVRALVTLAVMNTLQTAANTAWLASRAPSEFAAIRTRLRACALVGLLSVCGSAGWAIGVTLQNAAIVRTVGQVELVLAFLVGKFIFREPRRRSELFGAAIIVSGVAVVLVFG